MASNSTLQRLFGLNGRIAVVTGASSGIGRRMAIALASAGANIVILARREEALVSLKEEIAEAGGQAAPCVVDLEEISDFDQLAREAAKPFGSPDILVNAAGINLREPADSLTLDNWNRTLCINVTVPFLLARALIPGMREKGSGAIINIASLQSFRAFPDSIAYGVSKGGVAQLTRAMAEAWSKYGITANAILPGFFPTELTEQIFADAALMERYANATALGRNGELPDLDGATIFFAAPASAYITGQILPVDGGYTAK